MLDFGKMLRLHYLQTVSYLDEGNPWILGVGYDHLAVVLSLETCFLRGYPGNAVQPFHHIHYVCREFLAQPLLQVRVSSRSLVEINRANGIIPQPDFF